MRESNARASLSSMSLALNPGSQHSIRRFVDPGPQLCSVLTSWPPHSPRLRCCSSAGYRSFTALVLRPPLTSQRCSVGVTGVVEACNNPERGRRVWGAAPRWPSARQTLPSPSLSSTLRPADTAGAPTVVPYLLPTPPPTTPPHSSLLALLTEAQAAALRDLLPVQHIHAAGACVHAQLSNYKTRGQGAHFSSAPCLPVSTLPCGGSPPPAGLVCTPGLVDLHVHLAGGGGEAGPASRTPEAALSQLIQSGLTTVVGVTGTDSVMRSQVCGEWLEGGEADRERGGELRWGLLQPAVAARVAARAACSPLCCNMRPHLVLATRAWRPRCRGGVLPSAHPPACASPPRSMTPDLMPAPLPPALLSRTCWPRCGHRQAPSPLCFDRQLCPPMLHSSPCQENLVAKMQALREDLTALHWCGSYRLPPPTATGSVQVRLPSSAAA